MSESVFIMDEAYLFFPTSSPEERSRIASFITKLSFAGGKKKFHIYELQEGIYVDTGRVEELTYEEYMERYNHSDKSPAQS